MWIIYRSGRELEHFEGDGTPDREPLIEKITNYAHNREEWGLGEGGRPESLVTVVTAVQEEDLLEENGTLEILFAVDFYLDCRPTSTSERFVSTGLYSAFYYNAEEKYGDHGEFPHM